LALDEVDPQNARIFLELAEQRIEHLNSISNNLFGFMIVAISAIWGFYFTQNIEIYPLQINSTAVQNTESFKYMITPYMLLQFVILGGVTSALVGLWRWAHHVYDNDIARNYPEMMLYESILRMNRNFGITGYLNGQSPWTKKHFGEKVEDWITRVHNDVANRKIGMRGKLRWTFYSTILILTFTLIGIYIKFGLGYSPTSFTNSKGLTLVLFIIPYIIAWIEIFYCYKLAQKDKTITCEGIKKEIKPN
jgi:hypothetical protein